MSLQDIYNFLPISDALGTAGQPTAEQFPHIRAAGYEVVVNLAMPDSPNALPDEAERVAAQGMAYYHIPVVWESPTDHDLVQFFETLKACQGKKVFVHCVANMRVSAFVFLYRVLHQSVPIEKATQALLKLWQPDEIWQAFIDRTLAQHGHPPEAP